MKLRPYQSPDFDGIKTWISDERSHVMWCAGRFAYPLNPEDFEEQMEALRQRSGDRFFVAAGEDENLIGFFCLSVKPETRTGWLKYVIVSPGLRGKGYGREMIRLAVRMAFETADVDSVQLSVFSVNPAAMRCYTAAGFEVTSRGDHDFQYRNEWWGRSHMEIRKDKENSL